MNLKGKVQTVVTCEYQMGSNEDKNRKQTLSFNSNGNKIEEIVYVDKVVVYKSICKYLGKKLDTETIFNKLLKPANVKKKYTYDNKGRPQETKIMDAKNQLIQSLRYSYTNEEVRMKEYLSNSQFINETIFSYNSLGLLISETVSDTIRIEYEYNQKGQKINRLEYSNDDLFYKVDYKYDNQGNILSETSQYIGGATTVLSYYYQYDNKGNWISMREQMDGTTYAISTRDIFYYK